MKEIFKKIYDYLGKDGVAILIVLTSIFIGWIIVSLGNSFQNTPSVTVLQPKPFQLEFNNKKSNNLLKNTSPQIAQSEDKNYILCNGKRWNKCPASSKFFCPPDGGDATCISDNQPQPVTEREISIKSVVGLRCHYQSDESFGYTPDEGTTDQFTWGTSSGVIVNPEGYILTNKHIVDWEWSSFAYASSTTELEKERNKHFKFQYCEVGIPNLDKAQTIEVIKKSRPRTPLNGFYPYAATLYFSPIKGKLSDLEYKNLDFAILKITSIQKQYLTFGSFSLSSPFPYNPVLKEVLFGQSEDITNYGYPGEPTLVGTVGYIKNYYGGDKYFKDKFFNIEWWTYGTSPGSSGSPLFWKGYVIGINAGGGGEQPYSYAVGIPAIYQILKDNNLDWMLKTN